METSKRLFRLISGLMLALLIGGQTPPATAQNFSDNFEGAAISPFWTVALSGGTATLTSAQSHSSAQSLQLTAPPVDGGAARLWHTFPTPTKGTVSVWFYDTMQETVAHSAGIELFNSTIPLPPSGSSPGWRFSVVRHSNGPYYYIGDPTVTVVPSGANYWIPVVPRSAGWHLFEIKIGGSSVEYRIDGTLVGTYLGNFQFDSIALEVWAPPPGSPTTTHYFDDFLFIDGDDLTAPIISITAPTATTYLLNQPVTAAYTCTDDGSGVASCVGTVPSGSPIDTASVGTKTFTVTATDNAGNSSTQTVTYTVAYGIYSLNDQTKAHKSGSTIPIKLQLRDANGANLSSSSIVVHAVELVRVSTQTTGPVEDAGNANPDFNFRYEASLGGSGGYIFNLKTTGLTTGIYQLCFRAGSDPTMHTVEFQIK